MRAERGRPCRIYADEHRHGRRSPVTLLMLMSMASPIASNAWNALLNNVAMEWAA